MGSFDGSKKRIQPWKKVAIHLSLCFVMGFFVGFAPTSTASLFSTQSFRNLGILIERNATLNRSLLMSETRINSSSTTPIEEEEVVDDEEFVPRANKLLIVITTTRPGDRYKGPFLRRLTHTLKLVSSPILWVVVEARTDAGYSDDMLRRSGIMYRHLTYKENFTDIDAEFHHQRNVALNHIEYHRLNGVVLFADVDNVYDLDFFEEIRETDAFGAWPMVTVSANRKQVMLEGPICSSSKIVGGQLKDLSNNITDATTPISDHENNNGTHETKHSKINISSFAFNSSVLWDPERWGRPSSILDTSQPTSPLPAAVDLTNGGQNLASDGRRHHHHPPCFTVMSPPSPPPSIAADEVPKVADQHETGGPRGIIVIWQGNFEIGVGS